MNAKTRRAALAAASRVALGALSLTNLASCGGKTTDGFEFEDEPTEIEPTPPRPSPVAEAGAPLPSAQPAVVMDAGSVDPPPPADAGSTLACVGPVSLNLYYPEPPTISDAAFECCLTYALQYGSQEPSLSNCCAAIIVGVDQDYSRYVQASPARHCCRSADQARQGELWNHNLCAPWGPPVPPSLELEAEPFGVA